jgi:signal transduction histidine kinase
MDLWPQSLRTLVAMLSTHPLPMVLLWGPNLIQIYNGGYSLILDGKHPKAMGMPTRKCWPDAWEINAPIYERVLENGESVLLEDALFSVARDGPVEHLHFNVAYGPARDEAGRIAGIFVTVTETTEKVRAVAEQKRLMLVVNNERSRLAAIIQQAPAFICTLRGPDHVFEMANEQYYEIVGRREIIGKTVRAALPELEGQWFFEYIDHVYRTGETFKGVEIPLLVRRGLGDALERRMINFVYQVLREADGTISGIFVHGVDVTEQVAAREEAHLARDEAHLARDEADLANRAKDKFLAVLSHELRTPLTPVVMIAAAMETDWRLPPDLKEDMALIRRNVELETRLIDDLLDLSRIAAGKLRLDIRPVGAHTVVAHALRTVSSELHEKNLSIKTILAATDDRVDADAARLQQVLWNLLKNAVKFTPEGGGVTIATHNSRGRLVIEVRDTGRGIAADVLSGVFDPFEQGGQGITRRYGGMGLGLAIAKAVVDHHGGTIGAASEGEGMGTTFTVSLPLSTAVPTASVLTGSGVLNKTTHPCKVLLVEDHVDTAWTLVRLLKLEGYDVRWADSVGAALRISATEPFDVIVSDLGLPDGSGHDLMREVLWRHSTPGIAMSGFGMDEDISQSRAAGFMEHLVKPVTLLQLKDAIIRAEGSRQG